MGLPLAMTITDLDIVDLIIGLYAYPGGVPVTWDRYDDGSDDDGNVWAVKRLGEIDVVVNRGSVTLADFMKDSLAVPVVEPQIGGVHPGFYWGMPKQWLEVSPRLVAGKWVICGHSLGAGRGRQVGGVGIANGIPPLAGIFLGEPRPGLQRLADLWAPYTQRSYRNKDQDGHDTVTDVPEYLPPFFPYVHPSPLIDVTESPPASDPWGVFKWHHCPLYRAAIAKLNPMPVVIP